MNKILIVCTTDSMIWNFLVPHIKALQNEGYNVECACSITGSFFEDLKNIQGLTMHKMDFCRSPYSLKNFNAYFELYKLVKKRNINLIFCHEPVGGAMGRLVGHRAKCKVVYMAHGFHFYDGAPKSARIYYLVEKYLSKYTDALITINQEDYKAAQCFYAKENYLLPGIGVDISKFISHPDPTYLRNELGIEKNETILLSVGELIPRKNHISVINALRRMKNSKVHYVIAGEGELEQWLKRMVAEFSTNNIHFLGYRTDIDKLCNAADIFVMPSLQEGLSVALMEAMACGLPVIASRIRGNTDLIDDGKGGYLVDTINVKGYMEAIMKLYNNPDDRDKMGKFNMKKVQNYSIDNVKNMLIPIIEENNVGNK